MAGEARSRLPRHRTRRRSTDLNRAAKCTTAAAEDRNRACQPFRSPSDPIAEYARRESRGRWLLHRPQNIRFRLALGG